MGKFSRDKGKRGELELVRLLKENGYEAKRTAQYCGKTGKAADVIGLPGISIECKRQEKLNIYDAITQAQRDAEAAGRGDLPAVFHRKNNCPWLVTMRSEDWFRVYKNIPMAVIYEFDGYADGALVYDVAHCPVCDYEFEAEQEPWGRKYCPNCGQRIRWEQEV